MTRKWQARDFFPDQLHKSGDLYSTCKQKADRVGGMLNLGLNIVPWRGVGVGGGGGKVGLGTNKIK